MKPNHIKVEEIYEVKQNFDTTLNLQNSQKNVGKDNMFQNTVTSGNSGFVRHPQNVHYYKRILYFERDKSKNRQSVN